uniref:Uncharacterized protein n=1 Tax=Attheya septentrionalis TaxID=420275 RepID=A0A7S2UN54_9STRA|mmetsp:Transcript_3527/g.6459  ORF Transcript_3527/g.6459 Transcript_3527/m.6459 type:complete len:580 (+) Transcript_3527:135-1874(+)
MAMLHHCRLKRRRNAGLSQPLMLSLSIFLFVSTNGVEGFVSPRIKSQGARSTSDSSFYGMFQRTENLRRQEGSTILTAWTPKELIDKRGDYGKKVKIKDGEKFKSITMAAPDDLETITSNVTRLEMGVMSGAGLVFSVAVIYGLATGSPGSTGESTSTVIRELTQSGLDFSWIGGNGLENFLESDGMEQSVGGLARVTDAVIQTSVPQSATDTLAVALGEGISGVVGAVGTWGVGTIVQLRANANEAASRMTRGSTQSSFTVANEMRAGLVTEALANGDYFLTRAAVLPLLQAAGVPYFQASILSILLATIPYELVKRSSRIKEQKQGEDQIMEFLLQEEKKQTGKWNPIAKINTGRSNQAPITSFKPVSSVDLEGLEDPLKYVSGTLDLVELFSDVTKWLEYDVLKKDFGGTLLLNGNILGSGWESASFGFVAALSSQIYADVIYWYTSIGSDAKRREVRRRGLDRWASLYSTKCLSAAALFGVYDVVKAPTGKFIVRLLSGGIDSCLGSNDYDFCMDTYVMDNPPAASYEAELRGVFTAFASLYGRIAMGELDAQVLGRSVLVSIYSLISQLSPHFT